MKHKDIQGIYIYTHFCTYPRCSISGIFTYMYHKFKPNARKYTIHGAFGELYRGVSICVECLKMAGAEIARQHHLILPGRGDSYA